MVGAGYDIKHFPGRNDGLKRSRYIDLDNGLTSMKLLTFLKLTQMTLCALTAILLPGDIFPQPDPLNPVDFNVRSLNIKAKGLSIAHLIIRSLLGRVDQLNLIMSNNKGPDIWTFLETWLSNGNQHDEIHILGYNYIRRDREGK